MEDKVGIYIQCYNGEVNGTLKRAIDSILNQTYNNFILYIADNASTDGTRGIIEEYVKQDNRIHSILYENELGIDPVQKHYRSIETIRDKIDCEWWCNLDSDDEYMPNFLAEMIKFAHDGCLDMAICSSEFYNATTNQIQHFRATSSDLIITGDTFGSKYSEYHQFMRPIWGKLIKMNVIKALPFDVLARPEYRGDTEFIFMTLRYCDRVGISPKVLHRYYVNPISESSSLQTNRIYRAGWLLDNNISFLEEKCGEISPQNSLFIQVVYVNDTLDTLGVLLNSKASNQEKLSAIVHIFTQEHTVRLVKQERSEYSEALYSYSVKLFIPVEKWLLNFQGEIPDEQMVQFCDVGQLCCDVTQNSDGWVVFEKLRIAFLLESNYIEEARHKHSELLKLLPNDQDLIKLREYL